MQRVVFSKKIISTVLLGLFLTVPGGLILAAGNFTVSPLLLDYTTEGRDIITRTLTLSNLENRNTRVYASVHEVLLGEESEIKEFVSASMSNRATSITSWIEISRARVELPPLGQYEIPLTVRIHPETPAGTYHAFIGFASGANRDEIEAKILAGQGSGVIVKITIDDDRREQLHIVSFTTDRLVFKDDASNEFRYILENSGDLPLTPFGEVIIYNNRGEELTTVPINETKVEILPGEKIEFVDHLPFLSKLGKNKAYLNIEYGDKQTASVFDTAFYYTVPWYYLVLILAAFISLLLSVAVVFKRSFTYHDDGVVDGVYDVPLFVKQANDHILYDHDIDLKTK